MKEFEGSPFYGSPDVPAEPVGDQPAATEPGKDLEASPVDSESAKRYFEGWREAGYPPVIKGQDEIKDKQGAWEFMEAFYYQKWFVEKDEFLHFKAIEEINRLQNMFPELEAEVLKHIWKSRVKPQVEKKFVPGWWDYVKDKDKWGDVLVSTPQFIDEALEDGSLESDGVRSLLQLILWSW